MSGSCVDRISRDEYAADVQLATMFLLGKQQEVTQRLTDAMDRASERLAFEQAAIFRDQIQSLRQVQEKQYISSSKGEDVDIVVAIQEAGQFCLNLAMVRGGRHLGDRPMFPTNAGDSTPADAIAAFIRQHYAAHPAPARLIASPMPTNEEGSDLETLLTELAGRPVPLFEPRSLLHKAWSDMAIQNAKLAVIARNQASAQQEQRLQALQEALGLNEGLRRIECFDISHTQGEATVASCVVYDGNGMKKADYRRYNIRDIQPGDDYAAMRQVVTRRYEKVAAGEGVAPDLILIDGGKGQISSTHAALADLGLAELAMIGVAKGEDRKPGLETLIFPDDRLPLQLIQEIRDEAHRFAITGHRAKRSKARKTSTLESLPGIGPARRKALVSQFGGLAGVLEATIEQLVEVPGISREQAEKIHAALH